MNKRKTNIAYKLFYQDYKMVDKFAYIHNVMVSCKTRQQVDITCDWGRHTLRAWEDEISKKVHSIYPFLTWLQIHTYIKERVDQFCDSLLELKRDLQKKINC